LQFYIAFLFYCSKYKATRVTRASFVLSPGRDFNDIKKFLFFINTDVLNLYIFFIH